MRTSLPKLVLTATLALNVVLAVVLARRDQSPGSRIIERPLRTSPPGKQLDAGAGLIPAASSTGPGSLWEALESNDPRELVSNLRAVGCPEQTVQEIITLRLSRAAHRELLAFQDRHFASWKYWESQDPNYSIDRQRFLSQLKAQRDTALERLFGEDPKKLVRQLARFPDDDRRGFLPPDKKKALEELERRYGLLEGELKHGRGVYFKTADGDPSVERELEQLKQSRRAEIERLLTPEELLELDLRESPAADYVRRNSPEPKSEEEYRRMVKAVLDSRLVQKSESEELTERWAPADLEELKERRRQEAERMKMLQETMADVVGPERIQELERERFDEDWGKGRERFRSELMTLGEGLDIDSAQFDLLLEEFKPILYEMQMSTRGNIPEPERDKIERGAKAKVEEASLRVLGEKGQAFIQRWNSKMEEARQKR